MFTGIIEDVGKVKSIEKKGLFGRIVVETALDLSCIKVGDSIAVDGSCLRDLLRVQCQRFGQRRLSGVGMRDDGEGAATLCLGGQALGRRRDRDRPALG